MRRRGAGSKERLSAPPRRGRRGAINNLRELRIQAGLTQRELGELSNISDATICLIEKGKGKPKESTKKRLLQALSAAQKENEQPDQDYSKAYLVGEILTRDEFFLRLKPKMNEKLNVFFNGPLIATLVDNAEFFSRHRYYPGDFATAVEILGELLRASKLRWED